MRDDIQFIMGLVTAVAPGALTGTPPAGDPSYDVVGFFDVVSGNRVHVVLTSVKPQRPQVGVDVIPALVNTPCQIVMFKDTVWLFVTEQVPVDEACT